MRSSTKMSPRKLETAPGKSLVVQEDPLDDTYDHEDSIGYEGPFLCSLCDHRVVLSQASNRAVLNHWVREHGQPTSLVFHDEDSKEQLTVGHFFRTVAKCSRCEYFLGNNRFDADLYRRINKHWVKDHPEEDDEYEERDKLVVIKFKQEGEVDNNVDSDEDSDKVDPNLVYNGPFTCIVDGCKDSVDHTRAGWKMRCLDHFLAAHDHLINELKIKDEGSGRTLKVQHLFQFVGQCSQPDCHMIKGVNGRSAKNGRYEIIRTFRVHYAAQHPGIGENDAEFTMLVDNHNVKFETTGSKKNKAKEIKAKNDVTRDKKSVKYRCNFCDKEFGGVEKLSHWNRCHSHTPISLLAYTNTSTNQNTKAVDLMTSVGQCSLCKEYVGVEDGEDLQSVVRNHYSNTHKKNIKDVKCPDHFSVVFDSHSSVETAANDSEYGLDGFTCGVCSNKSNPDSNLTTMAVITHWNIEHLGSDINKFTLRCIRTGTVGDVFSIFLEVGFCKLKGCGLLIATRSKLRPLRREGKEHLKKYHPNEQLFNEAKHLKRVVKGEKLKSSKSVVKGVKEMKEILNPRHSVDSGHEERGELGLLTCAIEGCGEGEISLYGRHFSMSHKDVPMDQVRVRTDAGTFLSCHDLFNYAVRCSLKNCDFISVTGHSTDKPCLRSLKKHWARDHPDKTGELSYDNIMPPSPNSSPVKDVDQAQKRPLLVKEADPMSPVKKSKSGTQDKRVITTDPGTCYRCSICQKEVELRPGSSPLVHWTKEHSEQPALGLQMVRTSDGTLVNLRAMYRHIFQCQASTPCNYITVARTVDNSDAIKRLRIHWENRHRVDGDCSYRTVGDHLGFHCQAESCTYVLASADQLLEHHKQQHGGTKDMAVRDLETRDRLGVRDIFTWVRECQAAGCGAVFCGNTSEEETEQEAKEHWDQHHKDEDGVPHLPSLEATTAPCGFQCMAGAEDGEVVCATVIPPGNNGNALRHWQYKHPGLRLRDMIFMDHTSGDFLQISDVFKNVLVCSEEGCGVVIYTNFLDRGGKKMSTHWERDHRGVDVKQDVGPFKKLETRNFLDSNFTITHEDFIDFEREDEFENSTADEDINIDDEAEENAAEFTFEELEVIGYKCGVEGCHKVVAVSRFSTTMVALNRLKNHFTKMHRHLNSEQFIYDTQYNHNIDNAVNVNISETDQGRTVLVTPPKAQLPLEASPTTATSSNIVVWKCPGYVKSKGGQKLCKEMTTDPNSLRIHWGSQHNVDGLTFSPIQLDIEDTSHFVCSSTNPPCPYRSLTVGPMRLHWDKEHADQGNKFKVVYNEVKAILPAAPVVTESTKPVADLTTITATEAESVAASSEFSKTETEAIDESPMIPVGRKVKIAPPLPPGAVQRCGFVGCSFESESRRDLARHRKSVGHSKVTTPGGTGDVGEPSYECGHDGCGYRARGIRGIEHHMELSHGAVPEEDWNYKEVGSNKRQRSPSPAPGPSTTLPPQENLTPAISSPPAKQARKAVECDVSANFDMTGLLGEGTESTGDDSDSDFDLDYTVTPI